jgi:hypothetical protein
MQIRIPEWKKFGSGIEKIRIREKHPGFATLLLRQIYPQKRMATVFLSVKVTQV